MTFQNLRLDPVCLQTRNALIAAVAMILTACQTVPVEDDAALVDAKPDATATIEPRQSPNDQRSYRYLTLSNKLQVLLVSDPATDKSAAALSVYRGSFHLIRMSVLA